MSVEVLNIAATATIQDSGRSGYQRFGVSGGGAVDVYGLAEGQALLGNGADAAAVEFAQLGGRFSATTATVIATSGGEMALRVNGQPCPWRQSRSIKSGDVIEIGAAVAGVYGYLHIQGGFQTRVDLGSRSTHARAGLGHRLEVGDILNAGDRVTPTPGPQSLATPDYFKKRNLRAVWGPQSHLFAKEVRNTFGRSSFTVTQMRDRMGIRLTPDTGPVESPDGLNIVSDAVVLGDIQITGDGSPAVLLADRQPTGGYPRIGAIISADLPALVQIPAGDAFNVRIVDIDEAVAALSELQTALGALRSAVQPVTRAPEEVADLLGMNLIDGMIRGDEHDGN